MEEIKLDAKRRSVIGKQVKALRRAGGLPAILYGRGIDPIAVTLDAHNASRVLATVTGSHFIGINVEGDVKNVLVRERQRHPVTGHLLHVDFQVISMTEKLRTNVSIELSGDAPVVKEYNGVIVTGQEEIEVECYPKDLPERIVVDLSVLHEIGDAVYVRDLVLSDAVEILTDADEMIALVVAGRPAEEEVEEEVTEVEGEPEVIERGKREEEEGQE